MLHWDSVNSSEKVLLIAPHQSTQVVCFDPTISFQVNARPVRAPIAAFLVSAPLHPSIADLLSTFLIQSSTDSPSVPENFSPSSIDALTIGVAFASANCCVS